ncbi:MAG: LamG domain-containing protein [Bacteroidales bacterium]|jgi:hypothetical protein|nr:LamG domain-containing protein [Bacteroidales bacterium]
MRDLLRQYCIAGNSFFIYQSLPNALSYLNQKVLDNLNHPRALVTINFNMKSTQFLSTLLFVTLVLVFSCTKIEDPPTEGLLVYYNFEGNLNDQSSNSNDGVEAASGNYVTGVNGKGLDFDGISDYFTLTNTLNSRNGLTFSFWIKSRGAAGTENNGVIISKYNSTADERCFLVYSFGSGAVRSDNRLSAAFYRDGASALIHDNVKSYFADSELLAYPSDPSLWTIIKPTKLEPGNWTHCVINVTPTTLEAWLDGVLCVKKEREHNFYFDSPSEPICIGNTLNAGDGSTNHYNGVLDELRIYDRGLTEKEIQILYRTR